ncbi:MAG: aldehyde dehydrogenase family protein, partial [Campylobacterota bacterium]
IKNVCHSAFSNSGQKCSATSLLILEEEVYNDRGFKAALVDAAQSMQVGSVWDFGNRIGTLANALEGDLKKGVESLEPGESWALEPRFAHDNPYMLTPAIKWGVKEGNFCHMTELFGPVLAVMKAKDLKHAVDIVNATGYGLTSGIESLDEREIRYWKANIKAGNLYINRGTTGAIVLRQPFGGMGKSAIGAGRKVGIYNYVTQFVDFEEVQFPHTPKEYSNDLTQFIARCKAIGKDKEQFEKLEAALQSYLYNIETEFGIEKDYCKVRGEDNHFRYLPLQKVVIRALDSDSLFDVLSRVLAAKVSKVSYKLSFESQNSIYTFVKNAPELRGSKDKVVVEDESEFAQKMHSYERIIYADSKKVSEYVYKQATKSLTFIVRQKPMMEGRLELLNYFIEQAVSHSYHRYGNLGERAIR